MMKTMAFLCVLATLLTGCSSTRPNDDLVAVTPFEAEKYMGTWHEIARLPQWFQRGMSDVTATYSLENGRLNILNAGVRDGERKTARATGYFAGEPNVGLFRVTFFWPFYADYKVLWVSPAYDQALVTSEDRTSLWILARTKTLDKETANALVTRAESMGFDISRLEWSSAQKQ